MFEQQINNGVEYLNKNYPDWLEKINLYTLDMAQQTNCVIGQVLGDYRLLHLYFDKKLPLGFTCDNGQWTTLTEEWKQKIRLLLEESESASILDQKTFDRVYTKEQVVKLLQNAMLLGMYTRQEQISGNETRSGNEVLQEFIKNNV